MGKVSRVLGWALIALSLLAVAQSVREITLWEYGRRKYSEDSPLGRAISFAGHTFSVADDQPDDGTHSQTEYDGTIQPVMDGKPLGPPSHARVRRGLDDLGRYHTWYDAWLFTDRTTADTTLWLARRLQATEQSVPRFELTVVDGSGQVRRRVLSRWALDLDYRVFRGTQFVREDLWTVMPLSLVSLLGYVPPLLALFPIGSFLLGVRLLRRSRRKTEVAPIAG
jgi:hypothetical protein